MDVAGWPWWLFVEGALWALSIVGWRRLRTARLTDRLFWGGLACFNTGLILWTIGPWPGESALMGLALAVWLGGALAALGGRTPEQRRLGMVLALAGAAGTAVWLGAYEVAGAGGIAVVLLLRSGSLWRSSSHEVDAVPATASPGVIVVERADASQNQDVVELADSFHPTEELTSDIGGIERRDDWLLGLTLAASVVLGLGVLRAGLLAESTATGPNRWRMVWPQRVATVNAPDQSMTPRRLLPVEWWLAGGLVVLAAWSGGCRSTVDTTALQSGATP